MHALRIHDGNIYLDGTRIEGVKKYSLDWEQDELPVLKIEIVLKPVLNPELRVEEKTMNKNEETAYTGSVEAEYVTLSEKKSIAELEEELRKEALTYAINSLKDGSYNSESSEEIKTILSLVLPSDIHKGH